MRKLLLFFSLLTLLGISAQAQESKSYTFNSTGYEQAKADGFEFYNIKEVYINLQSSACLTNNTSYIQSPEINNLESLTIVHKSQNVEVSYLKNGSWKTLATLTTSSWQYKTEVIKLNDDVKSGTVVFKIAIKSTATSTNQLIQGITYTTSAPSATPLNVPTVACDGGNVSITHDNAEGGQLLYCVKGCEADDAPDASSINEADWAEYTGAFELTEAGHYYVYAYVKATDDAYADSEVAVSDLITIQSAGAVDPELSWTLVDAEGAFAIKYNTAGTYTLPELVTPEGFDDRVTYTSSNEDVAVFDAEGNITIKDCGTTTITATTAGESIKFNVATISYTLTIDPQDATLPEVAWTTYVGATGSQTKGTLEDNVFFVEYGTTYAIGSNSYQYGPVFKVPNTFSPEKLVITLCNAEGEAIVSDTYAKLKGHAWSATNTTAIEAEGLNAKVGSRNGGMSDDFTYLFVAPATANCKVIGTTIVKLEYLGDKVYVAGEYAALTFNVTFTPDNVLDQITKEEISGNKVRFANPVHPFARHDNHVYITDEGGEFVRLDNCPWWLNHDRCINNLQAVRYTTDGVECLDFVSADNSEDMPIVTARYFGDFNAFDAAEHVHALVHLENVHFNGTHISAAANGTGERPARVAGETLEVSDLNGVAESKGTGNYGTVIGYVEKNNGNYVLVPTAINDNATGIEAVEAEGAQVVVLGNSIIVPAGAEVYAINGARVSGEGLTAGVYVIRLADGTAVKVLVK